MHSEVFTPHPLMPSKFEKSRPSRKAPELLQSPSVKVTRSSFRPGRLLWLMGPNWEDLLMLITFYFPTERFGNFHHL